MYLDHYLIRCYLSPRKNTGLFIIGKNEAYVQVVSCYAARLSMPMIYFLLLLIGILHYSRL